MAKKSIHQKRQTMATHDIPSPTPSEGYTELKTVDMLPSGADNGSHTLQHRGRQCLPFSRTLGAPESEGIAYLNYINDVLMVVVSGLREPQTMHPEATEWILWLRLWGTENYLKLLLPACGHGLLGLRTQLEQGLDNISDMFISAELAGATTPGGRRVLWGALDRSCGPF